MQKQVGHLPASLGLEQRQHEYRIARMSAPGSRKMFRYGVMLQPQLEELQEQFNIFYVKDMYLECLGNLLTLPINQDFF